MKKFLLPLVAAALTLGFSVFSTPRLIAADASPVDVKATDGTGFKLKDRFNELYSGQVTTLAITYASTITVDFSAGAMQTCTLTGNVTLADSNLVAGKTCTLKLLASGGARNLTLPGGWINIGSAAPTALASGKTGIFVLRSWGTADSAVTYNYTVQP